MDRQLAPHTPSSRPLGAWLAVGLASLLVLGAAALVVSQRIRCLNERIELAERARLSQSADMRQHIDGVQTELEGIRGQLDDAVHEIAGTSELSLRLKSAEEHLGKMGAAIEAHSSSLLELEATQASFAPGIEKELSERDERLQKRYEALSELIDHASQAANDSRARVDELDKTLSTPPDLHAMWRELVGPVVQLAGETSVGSGVLLPSEPAQEGGFRTYVLTAWHVVRDIQGDPPDLELLVPVTVYREDGTTRAEKSKLLRHDPKLDVALLEILTGDALENGARLATPARLARTAIFDQVVAVGCPLGNDPIPTRGEIATCHHEVDGEGYWMINAPTYIGNSGGGIFDSNSHELMGIFSKIYTHGSLRPTIVPHMGLVTPLTKIYDWLGQVGYAALVPGAHGDHAGKEVARSAQ